MLLFFLRFGIVGGFSLYDILSLRLLVFNRFDRVRLCFFYWLLVRDGGSIRLYFPAFQFDPLKNLQDDGLWVKSMDLFMDLALLIVDNSVGERGAFNILHAKLRIPLAVEVVHFKGPISLRLEFVEDCFQVPTVGTVRGEELDKFEGGMILVDFGWELLVAYEVGIGHEPLFSLGQHDQEDDKHCPGSIQAHWDLIVSINW